jgi:hypothetical protein
MNQPLLLGVVVVAALIVAAIVLRLASPERDSRSLSRLEGKLDALLKHQGIEFDPYADLPAPVLEALRRGKKIEAIKEYRAATGAGLREAKEFVEELQRRASHRV